MAWTLGTIFIWLKSHLSLNLHIHNSIKKINDNDKNNINDKLDKLDKLDKCDNKYIDIEIDISHSKENNRNDNKKERVTTLVPTRYQAAMGLASSLALDISLSKKKPRPSVRELNRFVARDLNGGTLTFRGTSKEKDKESVINFEIWKELVGWIQARRNNAWLALGILTLVFATGTLWIVCPISVYVSLLVLDAALIFAGVVGTTLQTRRFLAVAGAILAAVVGMVMLTQGDTWIVWGELKRRDLIGGV